VPRSHPLYRQLARVWRLSGRWLPNGWLDAIRQLALFAGAYYLYRIVRGFVDGQAGLAFENARALVDIERGVGLFFEPGLQAWTRGEEWLLTFANWMYVNSHFVITTTFLIWLYIARNHAFYYVRNMFMVAMGLALVLYVAFPTAPPRFMPEWGFTDTVATFVGEGAENGANALYNPYAAVPSMHVAFALMIAIPAFFLVRSRALKALWAAYPAVVTFVVMATGNHFWLDAVLGALVAAAAASAASYAFARARPEAWAWRTRGARVTA
jgi:membrane-associated phospholipid phosphatase